jgi:hypothetical protein
MSEPEEPCPVSAPVEYFDGHGITTASLPCVLALGHDGHHVCETPAGPYEFEAG